MNVTNAAMEKRRHGGERATLLRELVPREVDVTEPADTAALRVDEPVVLQRNPAGAESLHLGAIGEGGGGVAGEKSRADRLLRVERRQHSAQN